MFCLLAEPDDAYELKKPESKNAAEVIRHKNRGNPIHEIGVKVHGARLPA
jgi:hypothetical protein